MIEQIYTYFSIPTIYMWLNIGVLPFWFMLFFFTNSKICRVFVTSVFPIFIFASINLYLIYEIYKTGFNFLNIFNLYLGFDELTDLFSEKNYIILFWIHFLSINLFCGCWIVRDHIKFSMPKLLAFFPLILTYFIGPLGLFIFSGIVLCRLIIFLLSSGGASGFLYINIISPSISEEDRQILANLVVLLKVYKPCTQFDIIWDTPDWYYMSHQARRKKLS